DHVRQQSVLVSLLGHDEEDHQRGHEESVLLQEEIRGLFGQQVAVLDRPHAALERTLDRTSGVCMSHAIEARRLRLLDSRSDLVQRELRARDPVGRRGDAARDHELDVSSPFAHFVTDCAPDLRDAVADATQTWAAYALLEVLPRTTHVAVTS